MAKKKRRVRRKRIPRAKRRKGKLFGKPRKKVIKRPGRLRKKAGVKKGQKIPVSKLKRWAKSKSKSLRSAANLALRFKSWRKRRRRR